MLDKTWRRVVIDSREVESGDLFVALIGERVDAHAFVAQALERGAAGAMVSRVPEGVDAAKCIVVEDTFKGLEALGQAARARAKAKIVGVTGSVGKTSAKDMLRLALGVAGETFASRGNFNNHIGTPLNLANLPESAAFAVFEMGMNHAGEIRALTRQVRPDVALITTVEAVHLELFDSVAAIADAKAEIFEGLKPGGTAVLNADNAQTPRCRAVAEGRGAKLLTFGAAAGADFRLAEYRLTAEGTQVRAVTPAGEIEYRLKALGAQWASLSLGVLAVAQALGLDTRRTAQALAAFEETQGRGRLQMIQVKGGEAMLLDDSYNASPAAMRAAFAKMRDVKKAGIVKGRLIAALSDMRELGETGPALHAELAAPLMEAGFDLVFTAGPLMRHLEEALPAGLRGGRAAEAVELLPVLQAALLPGDAVLVKGSHGTKIYQLAEALTKEMQHAV